MQQVAAVKHRNDLHSGWKDMPIEFLHLFVYGRECFIGICPFAQEHDALDHIVVVDHLSVGPMNGFSILSQTNLWPLLHLSDIPNTERGPVLCVNDRIGYVFDGSDEAYGAHVQLLQPRFNKTAAGIYATVCKLSLQLTDGEAIGDELAGIDAHLVFARHAAKA